MSISLGLAENYAVLGDIYLYMDNAIDITGFMGSNFLSYPPDPYVDSNGINLYSGTIPNTPIVNGAAALQAIDDVTAAVDIMDDFKDGGLYNGIPIKVFTFTGDQDLYDILDNNPPTDDYINVYKITGNLTMSANVDFTVNASTTCIFIATGYIYIVDYDITRTGGILPQNIIFIAGLQLEIFNSTVSGIYIATGDYVDINTATLTGRLISTDKTNNRYASVINSTVTAP